MHPQRSSTAAQRGMHEHGAILVLMAISLVCLTALLGLAIDAGNLYRAQLALQRAADARVECLYARLIGRVRHADVVAAHQQHNIIAHQRPVLSFQPFFRPRLERNVLVLWPPVARHRVHVGIVSRVVVPARAQFAQ